MKRLLILIGLSFLLIGVGAQPKLDGLEYWFNNDIANRISTPISPSGSFHLNDSLLTSGLVSGLHRISFRFKQDNGLWSPLGSKFILIYKQGANTVQKKLLAYEYWFNGDFHSRLSQAFPVQSPYVLLDSLPQSHLSDGLNTISFRFKDDIGLWSPPRQHFFVKSTESSIFLQKDLTYAEYWFNDDSRNKTTIPLPPQNNFSLMDSLNIGHLKGNPNVLHYRFKDNENLWTPLVSKMFLIRDDIELKKVYDLVGYRYWLTGSKSKIKEEAVTTPLPRVIIIDSLDLRHVNSGKYILNMQFKDKSGRWSTTISDSIQRDFNPYISFEASNTMACTGEIVSFSFDTSDVNQLIWNYGIGMPDTTLTPSVVYNMPGLYSISVTATNTDSNVSVSQSRAAYIMVSPSYDTTFSSSICEGDSLLFNRRWHSLDSTYSYVYQSLQGCDSILRLDLNVLKSIKDTLSANICQGENFHFGTQTLHLSGVYNETFAASNGCDSIVNLSLSLTPVDTSVSVARTSLSANVSNAQFQWLDCNSGFAIIAGATNSVFSPSQNGSYAVAVTENNCTDTSACYVINSIGLQESLFRQIAKVYPNPTRSFFFLEFNDIEVHRKTLIRILDARGRLNREIQPIAPITKIELQGQPAGLYLLELSNPGFRVIGRIFKH